MWAIANKTPFPADYAWVLDKDGNKLWLVVVKATFDVLPDGTCCLGAEQIPVFQMAEAYGDFGKTSLRYETDLSGVKPATDVLVRGDAVVPHRNSVTELDAVVSVGAIHKRLRVIGDRVWEKRSLGIRMSAPQPFERMPIVYERAYGGWDRSATDEGQHRLESRNPVGTGFAVREEGCVGKALPNVEDPNRLISQWTDHPSPVGFNAIDCAWSPRRELAGTYDDNWRRTRFPSWAEDFDSRYYNCAPSDQQSHRYLVGGEHVEVLNMSENGALSFELPQIQFSFRTRFGGKHTDHDGQLCTVIVEPNVPRVILAWQTFLICNRGQDLLDETLVVEKLGLSISQRR